MVSSILLWFMPVPAVPAVAVNAAYALHAKAAVVAPAECCGRCKSGVITHGDGHQTPCPCPPDCKCKAKTMFHQPICVSGSCQMPKR